MEYSTQAAGFSGRRRISFAGIGQYADLFKVFPPLGNFDNDGGFVAVRRSSAPFGWRCGFWRGIPNGQADGSIHNKRACVEVITARPIPGRIERTRFLLICTTPMRDWPRCRTLCSAKRVQAVMDRIGGCHALADADRDVNGFPVSDADRRWLPQYRAHRSLPSAWGVSVSLGARLNPGGKILSGVPLVVHEAAPMWSASQAAISSKATAKEQWLLTGNFCGRLHHNPLSLRMPNERQMRS